MSLDNSPASSLQRQEARGLIQTLLFSLIPSEKQQWLSDQFALLSEEKSNRQIDLTFGLCTRRLGAEPVYVNASQQSIITACLPGWQVDGTPIGTLARILVLSSFDDAHQLAEQTTRLLRHADLQEQLAIYRGLPLYPPSEALNNLVAEGLRSNISEAFEAIAHDNPYPAWHLDTHRFNHMVLKALFIDTKLAPVVGLTQRNNAELARMLLDYARERRAAMRSVSSELWALASPFMSDKELQEFDQEIAT